jgi:hypothetical protein
VSDAPLLVCRRSGLFSKTYDLAREGQPVGTIDFRDPTRGGIDLAGRTLVATRESRGAWSLESDDSVLATARRLQEDPLSIELGYGGTTWLVQASTGKLLHYDINERGSAVGHLKAKPGLVSNRLELYASPDCETELLAFCSWLVGIHWVGIVGLYQGAMSR